MPLPSDEKLIQLGNAFLELRAAIYLLSGRRRRQAQESQTPAFDDGLKIAKLAECGCRSNFLGLRGSVSAFADIERTSRAQRNTTRHGHNKPNLQHSSRVSCDSAAQSYSCRSVSAG
jgi:hypothetical protein